MSIEKPSPEEEALSKLKKTITSYRDGSKNDSQIIDEIKKEIFDNRRKDILKNYRVSIENSINTLRDHQKFTNIAVNPFIKIRGESVVPKHELAMLDPFVSLKELPLKKNFDALIINKEPKCNTLIFLETKTSKFSEKLLNELVKKIIYYESDEMQNFVKKELDPLRIDRIEYVLLIQPHRNDTARKLLNDKEIEIIKNGKKVVEKLPLIIWNLHPSLKKHNYFYLMIQPYVDNINDAIKLRQYHQNQNLIRFLSRNVEYIIFTSLVSLKFSPVLDFIYQLIMVTTELIKLYETQMFKKSDLKELIQTQLYSNLRIEENIEYIYEKIMNKGLHSKIFAEIKEPGIYKIRLRKSKQPRQIEKEIINRICSYKTEQKFNSLKVQTELHKKIKETFLLNPKRKIKTILDYNNS